jgi:Lrp/AsnC family transcriptional regulator for asnA, asnC and gidA
MSRLNQLDRALIELLNQDARLSSAEIARRLGVPERTVNYRIRRLKELNVIQPVAVVNPTVFGYSLAVDIFCELDVGFQSQAIEAILNLPEVCYVAITTGDQDLSLQAIFKNGDEMQEFVTHKLHQVPGMRRTRTVLIPRVLKDTYQWLPPQDSYEPKSWGMKSFDPEGFESGTLEPQDGDV